MKRLTTGLIALGVATFASASAGADAIRKDRSAERSVAFMRIYGNAQPPYGFVRFCEVHPRDCSTDGRPDSRFAADAARLAELDDVNRMVNTTIEPLTDLDLYGVTELWTYPVDKGDCEDYALMKRKMLMDRGWPSSSLLLTVVRDEKGDGHAVLTARTSQGDYILDNKISDVRTWNKTPYEFVMRQSYLNPRVWVSLDPLQAPSPSNYAGVKSEN
jgi:predicted transglutaminase-like cysteine proteinase